MKKRFFAICLSLLLISLLLCSCNGDDAAASTVSPVTKATATTAESTAETTSAIKRHVPKFEEIDLSDANIEDFEASDEATDYVLISVEGYGDILVRLFPEVAPKTVANFKMLVANKFYDGLIFHRVIEGFMIQGGGITADFYQKPANVIAGEFASNGFENNLLHVEGVLSMARTNAPNSATSQFFIMHKTSPHLDGEYAAFGYAAAGRDVVDAIAKCEKGYNNIPVQNVVITSARFVKAKASVETTNAS